MASKVETREEWLMQATQKLGQGLFGKVGYTLPKVRVSVGFPYGSRGKVIGQCFDKRATADGVAQIFIHPKLDEGTRVLDVLAHELVHAILGAGAGHGQAFKRCASAIGLEGQMTATTASPVLQAWLTLLLDELGAYPHASLDPNGLGRKKQGTRLIKVSCGECGYNCRVTRTWLDDKGAPLCPCNGEQMGEE